MKKITELVRKTNRLPGNHFPVSPERVPRRLVSISICAMLLLLLHCSVLADNTHITFTNARTDQPDLYVTKTVTSAVAGYDPPNAEFTFILKWDPDKDGKLTYAKNETYTVYAADGTQIKNYDGEGNEISWKTTAAGRFTIKAGQTAKFEYAGNGVEYEITEILPDDCWIQTIPANGLSAAGKVEEKGTVVCFENMYIPEVPTPPGGEEVPTSLSIKKVTVDENNAIISSDAGFQFTVTIGGSAWSGKKYTIYDSDGTETGTGISDDSGSFVITGGQRAVFDDIPLNEDYTGTETGTGGWECVTEASVSGGTTYPVVYTSFTNRQSAGRISLTKVDASDHSIRLEGAVFGIYSDEGCSEDSLVGTMITDENGSAVSEELSSGRYYVKETTAPEGYRLTDMVFPVTVEAGNEANVLTGDGLIENTQIRGSIRMVKKDASGALLFGVTFMLEDADGKQVSQTTDAEGEVLFEDLPAGTYVITETATVPGSTLLADSIEVVIPLVMTEEEVEAQGNVDLTDAELRDGSWYFYNLTYEVTNGAQLSMPASGGAPVLYGWIGLFFASAAVLIVLWYLTSGEDTGHGKEGSI
ncbi:MAG: DUF5979 domain-containing protein [Lachnospiraceae bacterium]|nr:DUF5979 domain-containing protein [Lachnospiraceae bacterium]